MAANTRTGKKFFTAAEANAALPLVRAIVRDITVLAKELRERYEGILRTGGDETLADDALHAEFEAGQDRLQEYADELQGLGIHLKDPYIGLVDFPCWMKDHEVYLCWKLDEADVAHWHEIEAGFAGRRKLTAAAPNE